MITTGDPGLPLSSARKTEIVDVANGVSCSDLSDFPDDIIGAVGANLDGTPVVCGGYTSGPSEKCYKFTNGMWEEFATMKEKRYAIQAAGVVYNKKLHVFGGISSGSSALLTSETINIDGVVSDGPDMPTGVWKHAMTTLDDTVSIFSGGWNPIANTYSARAWYYNHGTEAFTSGPDLLVGRSNHGSATNVDKVTKVKIAVVTGGYRNGNLDSTELLINGQWQTGTIQYRRQNVIICSSAIFLT